MILKTTRAVTVTDAPRFPHSNVFLEIPTVCWDRCLDICFACCWFCLWCSSRVETQSLVASSVRSSWLLKQPTQVEQARQESRMCNSWVVECGGASDKRINHSSLCCQTCDATGRKGRCPVSWCKSLRTALLRKVRMAWKTQRVLGIKKRQPKNLHRDLMTLFGTPRGAPAFTWLRIPMRNGPDFHPVLLPHVFFSELFQHRRSLWEDSIRGPPGATRESWQRLQHWAGVRDPPHLPRARWAKTVPLGLHGDAGPFTKQDSAFVISWNELLGAAANKGFGRRWLITVIRKNDLTDATLDALWKVFGWSMNVLLSGILPDRDWSGNEVPSGGKALCG